MTQQKVRYLLIVAGFLFVLALIVVLVTVIQGPRIDSSAFSEIAESLSNSTGQESEALDIPEKAYIPVDVYPLPENAEVDWEPTFQAVKMSGAYENDRILTFDYYSGSISAGVEDNMLDDALYLNLRCSEAAEGNEIGYYISASRGCLEYSRGFVGACYDEENRGYTDFAITKRLYSKVRAISFEDGVHYGLRWMDINQAENEIEDAVIQIRVVNLVNSNPLCICDLSIRYDAQTCKYYLAEFTSSDVKATGELSREERSSLVDQTIAFAENVLELGLNEEDWKEGARAGAIVDKTDRPYFNKMLDKNQTTATYLNDFPTCSDTFAVTMPISLVGSLTVYFAPWYELYRMQEKYTGEGEIQKLVLYAYDPLLPCSEKTILVPHDGQWDELLTNG